MVGPLLTESTGTVNGRLVSEAEGGVSKAAFAARFCYHRCSNLAVVG